MRAIHLVHVILLVLVLAPNVYFAVWSWGKFSPSFIMGNLLQAFLPLGICVVSWILFVRRRRRQIELGGAPSCAKCGYNLTSNESGICPECGHRMDRREIFVPLAFGGFMKWHRRTIHITHAIWLAILLLSGVLLTVWCWGKISGAMLLPYLIMAFIAIGGCVFSWIEQIRRWRRENELDSAPSCAKCGYNLIGNMTGACPECGTAIARQEVPP